MSLTPITHSPAPTRRRGLVLLIGALTLGFFIPAVTFSLLNRASISDLLNFPILLTFSVVSLLVTMQRPTNGVGWFMAVGTLFFVIQSLAREYAVYTLQTQPGAPLGLWVAWVALWTAPIGLNLTFICAFLLFPTGRLPSHRWHWIAWCVGGVLVLHVVVLTFQPSFPWFTTALRNPLGLANAASFYPTLLGVSEVLRLLVLIIAIAAPIVRFRKATGVERQQLKWVAYAGVLFLVAYILGSLLNPRNLSTSQPLWETTYIFVTKVALVALPLAIATAILRYRLWDIDFLVNRSLVYGVLTLALALVFGGSLWLVSQAVQGQAFTLAFGVTALVAGVLFNPARRWVQRFVDQHFYHIYIDYQKTPVITNNQTQILRQTYFGAYQKLDLIGRGGMAEVYRAAHPTLNTFVAIKILPAHLATAEEFRQRFVSESEMVVELQHPNIVRIYDYGEQDNTLYMVMEYLDGQDLGTLLKQRGRLPLSQIQDIVVQIAAALDYAHVQGVVHRDIKPSNVILETSTNGSKSRAVLMDFGIAKMINANTAVTQAGNMLGTLDYIAPEQIQASPTIDGKADIYALGVMVYQMVTGELPFKHQNPGALLIAHLTQLPPNPREVVPELPKSVALAIQRAMSKKPDERFATAMDFAQALADEHQ